MTRYRLKAGHETRTDGLISLYAGLEVAPGLKPGFFVTSSRQKLLNRKQFKLLDDTLRFKEETDIFVLMTSNDHKYFWRRLAVQLNRCFPKKKALTLFVTAWNETV
tara:strand:+ start:381 stop:698 length:318 start_codon:yes stop_codon:yes gene_type:complete